MRVVTYRRVSTQEQGDSRAGLEAQEAALQAFIAHAGLELVGEFVEVASGKLDLDRRQGLREAVEACRKHGATLLVSKLDRLSRSVEFIATLMNSRTRFATVEDGLEANPAMLHMRATFAEHERRLISERTRTALAAKKAAGVTLGWASHKSPTVSRSKASCRSARTIGRQADSFAYSVAPTIRSLQATGKTLAEVADELNRIGVRTSRGGQWYASTVCNLLKRASP